jgi:hypothetical protein
MRLFDSPTEFECFAFQTPIAAELNWQSFIQCMKHEFRLFVPCKLCDGVDSVFFHQEPNQALYRAALESLRGMIRSSTTSMTSVPKPLKFLRPHFDSLKEIYEKIEDQATQVWLSWSCCYCA